MKSIVLGGGCFWCTEAVMQEVVGVMKVTPGYAGGHTTNPTYEEVMTGETGHAEVVKVEYDDLVVQLLNVLVPFFRSHDPSSLNRQGADIGTQYRSTIYYQDETDVECIRSVIDTVEREIGKSVVTEVKPLDVFYEAEPYHHNYYRNNPYAGYCQAVIAPKLQSAQWV